MYKKGKNRRVKRNGTKLLLLLVVIAVLLGGFYYFLETYTVKTVIVEGNVHYTKEEIEDMVMKGPLGNNSFCLSRIYDEDKPITDIPFVAAMNVEVVSPDTIKIKVYEKSLAGYVKYLGRNMYFDMDGTVVESSTVTTVGVPEITGLTFDHVILGEPLPVEDMKIFNEILTITKLLTKNELTADSIYFGSGSSVILVFERVRFDLGEKENLDEKMGAVVSLLPSLSGMSGVVDLQKYDGDASYKPIFKPD